MSDQLGTQLEPAFKGSFFSGEEYREVWGDDWPMLFLHGDMPPQHLSTDSASY